ncbi:LRRN4 C-terminal-like protein [Hippoglossus stenolepis]|uniref:LRRN4 C-terminal-like protein n=1 Tax=Hippoglossus stenolepis TaxID=195615 RepID=UPI001FAFB996|nr:LRRN4 C-terminal-like protein [Hippoglossus stenolepis]XP_035034805.2 LRRN4 C-terminal-like protein [Hippoglossus stenolepis]XP_035034806.2 LRRN4 C-terminal-like protein [Hippoglossus stenolepis]
MLTASRVLPFPPVIVCLFFISGCSPLPTSSQVADTNPMGPLRPHGFSTKALRLSTEDYDELEDKVTTIVPRRGLTDVRPPQRCNYDPCLEGQISCSVLRESTKCSCPGHTLHNQAPEAPNLRSVSWNGSDVVIQWCAPYSYVTTYLVTVGDQQQQIFGKEKRSGGLGILENIAEVCVVAVNGIGSSPGSCMMYHPRDSSLPLTAGLIGGALGFLLLLLLAVLLWRHKRQRKQEASISMRDTADTQ